jgi:hypothetical protein
MVEQVVHVLLELKLTLAAWVARRLVAETSH